ncbi:hypothetical protein K435DRAFT_396396 [Dendrothele bispora CBS 962.96]|uniref:Uncharacterized protein n=1 Tax=Dendrothele bispora (strain CBS 962.96) TaxID=1314807 RepID=A0A4S8MFU7_DENBC|nr:hypothetical protein K435DRAFT_396396 [Dendrothele bispora CBS 962.96]
MIIGSQPAIYLVQANLDSFLFEGFMGNGFAAGGQRTATVNVENFHGFPTRILGPGLMDEFREQFLRFGTDIIIETISKINLSHRPFRYWREGVRRMRSPRRLIWPLSLLVLARKRLGLKGEEAYWQSGISACAVCNGVVPIFRNKPLAVIGGGDSAAEEATCTSLLTALIHFLVHLTYVRLLRCYQ